MNERIKELNAQADKYAWEKVGKKYDGAGDLNWKWEDTKMEKFAELIVRECIRVPYNMWDTAELNADIAVKIDRRIKDHFGVEE